MSCKKCRHWFVNPNIVIPGEPTEGKCLVSEIKTQSNQVCNAWERSQIAELKDDNEKLTARIAELEAELKITDELLKEATETIGAVVACCTYNSNDDAKIGIYGIDQKAFTRIDQFITHYNDAVYACKVSVDVKRELTDAEIEELGAQEAERKEFCPNCEAETPCTHEAELFVCDICGEDFAKYIVSRNCNVSDVSITQDVLTDVKTPRSAEIERFTAHSDIERQDDKCSGHGDISNFPPVMGSGDGLGW